MINYLKGNIQVKNDRFIILNKNNIGFRLYLTNQTIEAVKEGEERAFFVHTHVREDALELYGFSTWDELEFFEKIITVSGVGPKSGLAVLSIASLEDIKKAVVHGDPAILQKVAGIGKKTAERIIVELKEKVAFSPDTKNANNQNIGDIQVIEALSSLGYREIEIRQAVRQLPSDLTKLEDRIKAALKVLGQNK